MTDTQNTQAHTAGPWQTKHDYDIESQCTIISNLDGEIHGDGTTSYTYDTVAVCGDEFGEQMNPANAARIVACVNALDGLNPDAIADVVAALKTIKPYLIWTIGDESPGHHPTMPSAVNVVLEAITKLEAQS